MDIEINLAKEIFKALQDDTRFSIYLYLAYYGDLTLKELSEHLNKGKTTIHHHIRKLEESGLIDYEEKEDDKKKLKTRFYSLKKSNLHDIVKIPPNKELLSKLSEKEAILVKNTLFSLLQVNSLILEKLIGYVIDYTNTELKNIETIKLLDESYEFIQFFPLTEETLPIYNQFISEMKKEYIKARSSEIKSKQSLQVTHIGTNVIIPIRKILEKREETEK